ncbi:MAG: isoprenyl transferase [Anaeroplasmataceae bacterium]|nr:isoprenyl transferase [Anaeroplasmataceae bacterium]
MNIDPNKIPKHVAMILDGNGRWAKKRFLPRTLGHRKGAFNIVDVAKACDSIGIKYLTMFCFSTENWNRPKDEVNYLMNTPVRYYKRYKEKIKNSKMRVRFIGRRDRIPTSLLQVLEEIEENTKDHTGITLTLCVDYGAYDEITTATKEIATLVKENKLKVEDITPSLIESHLFTKDYPKLDLLIRTSGEIRISNYLLWQLGYAELYFTDTLWPDFNEKELEKAIISYQSRNRRFGGLNENK